MKQPVVYIMASRRNGTLYTGVTSNLVRRVWEHRTDLVEGFTRRYGIHSLVYFEMQGDMPSAIQRETQIKRWNRAWKLELIERSNPEWMDLWPEISGAEELDSGSVSTDRLDRRFRGNDEGDTIR